MSKQFIRLDAASIQSIAPTTSDAGLDKMRPGYETLKKLNELAHEHAGTARDVLAMIVLEIDWPDSVSALARLDLAAQIHTELTCQALLVCKAIHKATINTAYGALPIAGESLRKEWADAVAKSKTRN
ncbi:MAG TPA: hypothetical protein VK629_07500 [Steroidobacteraceae bacterium]|nr:hypothetical protein [Steroidobacteraceae bacterium]